MKKNKRKQTKEGRGKIIIKERREKERGWLRTDGFLSGREEEKKSKSSLEK